MKFIQITAGCDMTRLIHGGFARADRTVYIAYGTDAGKLQVRELDLTDEWDAELARRLSPFLEAAHDPDEIAVPGSLHRSGTEAARRTESGDSVIAYNRDMRAWADKTGYEEDGKPGYHKLAKGGYYHSSGLKQAYAEHLVAVAADAFGYPPAASRNNSA